MSTIEQQLDLERRMFERGKELYRKSIENSEENGRGHETLAARRLMADFLLPLAEGLTEWCHNKGAAVRGSLRPLLRAIDPHSAMYLTLQCLFDSFTFETSMTTTAAKIGRMIEDELRFTNFQNNFGDYYKEIQDDFQRKGTKSYQHKHRVLTYKASEHQDGWTSWLPSERVAVGVKLIDIVLGHTDLIEKVEFFSKGKTNVTVQPTKAAQEWIDKHHELRELMFPDRMPTIIEPDDWTGLYQGGYYSPELRNTTTMVKANQKAHRKALEGADLSMVSDAINTVQAVPWAVNERVLEVIKLVWARNLRIGMPASEPLVPEDSPFKDREKGTLSEAEELLLTEWKHEAAEVYTLEKERIAKSFQIARIMRMASEYSQYDRFWYVWYCDFRGRMYTATASFSPQGPDVAKGAIRFANGKPLGERGWYWLRVHMANRFGYDKVSYDARVEWVDQQQGLWLAIAEDPISHATHWKGADKPYQFLAAIFEYADAINGQLVGQPPSAHVSYLPIGLDGSCNGLQNFSAMLRDEVGGRATNLVGAEVPSDIYRQVATVCMAKLNALKLDLSLPDAEYIHLWCQFAEKYGDGSLPRDLAKRPVMTLPYGATRQSCTKYIFEAILKKQGKNKDEHVIKIGKFKASTVLTPLLWESIGEVVVAARAAMGWLQDAAGAVAKQNSPVQWTTPDGFIVHQALYKSEILRVRTQLAGEFRLRLAQYTDEIDSRSMRQSISPNFVHSYDASHLRETVRRCAALGITDIACIHDDYGTHACDTDTLHKVIREAFVDMYGNNEPLNSFKLEQEAKNFRIPALPPKGTLDINSVLDSPYFFG